MALSYEILPGFQATVSLGYTKIEMNQNILSPMASFSPAFAGQTAIISNNVGTSTVKTWIVEPQLNYGRTIFKGRLDASIGATIQENNQTNYSLLTSDYPSDELINDIGAAGSIYVASYNYADYKYAALYGRIGYNWKERYILNVTARRDGSSRFGPGYQYGNFGAVGAAWIFTKERFLENISFLNFGKLRASYGTTGNDQIPDYRYLSSYTAFDLPYQGLTGLYPTNIANPYYRWEVVKKLEVGMDLGFFRNRFSVGGAMYINHTDNQLVGYALPYISGFSTITANLPAKIENYGYEATVSSVNVHTRHFSWNTAANISVPRNKLIAYPNLAGSSYANSYTVGRSLFSSKGYNFTGVDPQTGLSTYQDVNKDSKISSPADYLPMKAATQNYYGAFSNTLKYNRAALDFMVQYVSQRSYDYVTFFSRPGTISNQPTYVLARWRNPGDITNIQKFSENNSLATTAYSNLTRSDRAYGSSSFVRLKNVTMSYDIPFGKNAGLLIRVYVEGQNLVTFTKVKGLDPQNQGLSLPPLRMIVGGVKINL